MGNAVKVATGVGRQIVKTVFIFALGIAAGVVLYITKPWASFITPGGDTVNGEETSLTTSTVQEIVQAASDLITTKYTYKDADTYENYKEAFGARLPFTTDKVVFTYTGVISVGVDLSTVQYQIDEENKTITITLPPVTILTNEVDADSFEYPFVSDSIFNGTHMDDYTGLIGDLKKKKAEELQANTEFMATAETNTQTVLTQFLTMADATKDYTVTFE